MIRAAPHRLFAFFFDAWMHLKIRRSFREVVIHNNTRDQGRAILVIANHVGWWDGFWARYMNARVFRRRLHVMMLEDELKKRKFLRWLGAFSIQPGSRSAAKSLLYAKNLLSEKPNMVLVYPQGRFESMHQHPLQFEKGWFRMTENPSGFQYVFMACLTDYFKYPRPGLSIYLETPKDLPHTAEEVESSYNAFLKRSIESQNAMTQ